METKEAPVIQLDCSSIRCIVHEDGDLGGGSFGVVRAGFHEKYGPIAAKCIHYPGRSVEKKKFMKKISNEVLHLHKANHENVVRLFGLAKWLNWVAIVMEYLPNGNLKELIVDEDVKIGALLRFRMCAEIANGLAFIHNLLTDKRLVHGDLKAENILLSDDLHCKIADFGSSVLSSYTGNTTLVRGKRRRNEFTEIYAAPELLLNYALKLKPSNDTYSFGIIIFMILKREYPISSITMLNMYLNDVKEGGRPKLNIREISSEFQSCEKSILAINQLNKAMKSCLEHDAQKRPGMKEVRDALYDIMIDIPSSEIHSQVALATSKMTVMKFSQSKYPCVTIDKLNFERTSERHTEVSASSMCSSNSGSDAGSISEEQPIESEISSLSQTVVETSSSPKQDVTAAKLRVTSESCNFLQEDQPSASVHAITQQIPIAMPRKSLRQSDTDLERTTISATLKPSSVDEFYEIPSLSSSSSSHSSNSAEKSKPVPYIPPHHKRRSCTERHSRSRETENSMAMKRSTSIPTPRASHAYYEPSYNGFVVTNQQDVFKYNAATFECQVLPRLQQRHGEGSLVNLENKIYAIGGWKTKHVERLDLTSEPYVWRDVSPTNEECEQSASVVCNGYIYNVGGGTWRNPKSTGERYDPIRDKWLNINNMNQKRQGHALVELNNHAMYALGGRGLNSAEVYYPDRAKWVPIPPMHSSRFKLAAAVLNGKIYAIGGEDCSSWRNSSSVECFDPVANRWMLVDDLKMARSGHGACVIDKKIFVVGGSCKEIESYHPLSNCWKYEASIDCDKIDSLTAIEE